MENQANDHNSTTAEINGTNTEPHSEEQATFNSSSSSDKKHCHSMEEPVVESVNLTDRDADAREDHVAEELEDSSTEKVSCSTNAQGETESTEAEMHSSLIETPPPEECCFTVSSEAGDDALQTPHSSPVVETTTPCQSELPPQEGGHAFTAAMSSESNGLVNQVPSVVEEEPISSPPAPILPNGKGEPHSPPISASEPETQAEEHGTFIVAVSNATENSKQNQEEPGQEHEPDLIPTSTTISYSSPPMELISFMALEEPHVEMSSSLSPPCNGDLHKSSPTDLPNAAQPVSLMAESSSTSSSEDNLPLVDPTSINPLVTYEEAPYPIPVDNHMEKVERLLTPQTVEVRTPSTDKENDGHLSMPHKYATVDYRRKANVKSSATAAPTSLTLPRRRSHDDITHFVRESFRMDLNHNLREMDEALKQAEAMEKSVINDDSKFPDSVTPTKVDQTLTQQGYDIPFIDDAAFYYKDWYVMEDHCWSRLETAPVENGTAPTENKEAETIVPTKTSDVHKAPKPPNPILASNESLTKRSKPKGRFSFCGCMGKPKK